MQKLKQVIARHQSELRKHPLFELLETTRSADTIAQVARALAWWPMVFQDVLRLNVEFIKGSGLEHLAEQHRLEDAGHDRWFVHDLAALKVDELRLDNLFADDYQPIRDACYALVSWVHAEQPAVQRLAFVRALEPTGHVFFEAIVDAAERLCPELRLHYFSRSHLCVEHDHDLFSDSTDAELDAIVLNADERERCEAVVARVFQTFADIFSYLDERATNAPRNASHINELPGGAVEPVDIHPQYDVRSG